MGHQGPTDPLAFKGEDDMDDLTAHLEDVLNQRTGPSADDLDDPFGDGSELPQGLDRYRVMDDDDDNMPRASGHPGLPSGLDHPNLTYGNLVAPSSHEDHHYGASHPVSQQQQHQQQQGGPLDMPGPGSGQPSFSGQPAGSGVAAQAAVQAPSEATAARGPVGPQGKALMRFTVTDPVKREAAGLFGLKAGHVTYLVTTTLHGEVPGYTRSPSFTVRRRFRDFVSLADTLKVRFRGYFLPPRPEKNAVEGQRMTDTFVEDRRLALERYLNRLAQHPVIATSQELRVFVEAAAELESCPAWTSMAPAPPVGLLEGTAKLSKQLLGFEQSVLDPVQAVQPTKKVSDPLRAFRETAQAMSTNNTAATAPLPPGEAELRHDRENLEGLRDALAVASRAAERLVHRMDRCAAVAGDAGLAFFKLSKFEEAEGPHLAQFTGTVRQSQSLAVGTKVVATSLVRAARIQRRAVGKSAAELSALHDQLAAMPSAIKGLSTREKQLLTTDTLTADVEARQKYIKDLEAAGAKTLGGDAGKAKRVEDLRNDVSKLQCSISAAKAEYERIMAVNKQELSRTQGEFQSDMIRMVRAFSASQAVTAQRAAEVWLQLASELGSAPEALTHVRHAVLEAQQRTEMSPQASGPSGSVREYSLTGAMSGPLQYSPGTSGGGGLSGDGAWATAAGEGGPSSDRNLLE